MNFNDEINTLENKNFNEDIVYKKGGVPILFTSPHTMMQVKSDGSVKLNEPYTKALTLYFHEHFNTYALIKTKDTGLDPNRDNHDEFKKLLYDIVRDEDIALVIDLHGASKKHDFDVEFGTLNNLTADYSTINELVESLSCCGIKKVEHNSPFKGGAITQYLYNLKNVDVIQLEINYKYRDKTNLEELKRIVDSLKNFIEKYIHYRSTRERTIDLSLYEPINYKDYWYLKQVEEDEETMSYNAGYEINVEGYHYNTGIIELKEEKFEEKFLKNKGNNIYIAYLKDNTLNKFVGYVTYHLNKNENRHYCGVLIENKYRGQGYSKHALTLLIDKARQDNIKTLYNSFEESRLNAITLFSECGFKEVEAREVIKFGKKEKSIVIKLDL